MYSKEDFIRISKNIHGDIYDYSKVDYVNTVTKVCIICPKHGEFWQEPRNHMKGSGCFRCSQEKKAHKVPKMGKMEFIDKSKKIHGNKYDYSKVEYVNSKTKVCIICQEHGEFWQTPNCHLNGQGCPICRNTTNGISKRLTTEEFVRRSQKIHGNKYDYSKVNYTGLNNEVKIICPVHGIFYQKPAVHMKGSGCKECNTSILENDIINLLNENKIEYIYNSYPTFMDGLQLDFWIPSLNIAIECQGIQHFSDGHFFEKLSVIQERDERKKELCDKNGIKLLYYSNLGIKYPYKVYENKEKIIRIINEQT